MRFLRYTTSDLDEARGILAKHFYANRVELLPPRPERWLARFDLTPPGPITIGDLSFGADTRFQFGELGAYHVDVPRCGALEWRQGAAAPRQAGAESAAMFQPVGDTYVDRWTGDCRLIAVKIERAALESTLAGLLGAPVTTPVRFGPEIDLSTGAGAAWLRLLNYIADDLGRPDGLLEHPTVGDALRESLITGLLLAADHPYRDRLYEQSPALAAPATVRRAVDAMADDPAQGFTLAGLSDIAGVGPRSLQQSFQRYLGVSPMAYLRDLRLGRAHDDLRRADPAVTTVARVAHRNGFTHLGRFAVAYRRRYGVSPHETLRG